MTEETKPKRPHHPGMWVKGESGNPTGGRPPDTRRLAALHAEKILHKNKRQIMQRLVERAIEGEPRALALAVARLLPEMREQPRKFKLSPVTNVASATQALSEVVAAISSGLISPNEGSAMAGVVSAYIRALEATSIEKRLEALEEAREQREQRENRPFLQEAAE